MLSVNQKRILQGKDSAKYTHEGSYKEKTSKPRKRCQPSTTIKTPKPVLTKVRIIHPSSDILELWEVLTWPSEGIQPAPHRCSLLGLFFLLCRYCFEHMRTVWLTVDFSACKKWQWLVTTKNSKNIYICAIYFKITCLSFSLGMHVGNSVEKSKRSDQIDLFHTGHAALLFGQTGNQFAHEILSNILHACMHEIENTYTWLSSIYHDRSQYFFFFNGCCYTKKYTSKIRSRSVSDSPTPYKTKRS